MQRFALSPIHTKTRSTMKWGKKEKKVKNIYKKVHASQNQQMDMVNASKTYTELADNAMLMLNSLLRVCTVAI